MLIRPPGTDGRAYMVKVPYGIDSAEALLGSMRRLSEVMHSLVDALLLSEAYGDPVLTALIAPDWDPLP